ncbi:hypothetical protein GPECTOR_35g863 [Gonium pectorale]|uniref:Ubiquitin-like domain-containing protein n=1 Tax=Gonium pectorale TaxID=33097 RepID=A0A150GCW7_GONPE|nr:hypothetical protein GPECTOR_35g863 [Gonium pectorale]|eukprot:KXZ47425.1 hypothetical protein GPECTOR_35g863 [Gonium pectorale]
MTGHSDYRVKFVSDVHEPDLVVKAGAGDLVEVVIQQVRRAKQIPPNRHLRILCAGRELYYDDPVSKATARVLHCIVTDTQPQRPAPAPVQVAPPQPSQLPPQPPPQPVVEQPPVDWLDVVDPGTVLMWIFGSILALLWLLFVFYAHMFDRTSVVMLVMMTVAFLIPCVLSYLPWPTFLQPQPAVRPPGAHGPYDVYDPATGRSTAVAGPGAWHRHPYDGDIPPRPPARVRPPS